MILVRGGRVVLFKCEPPSSYFILPHASNPPKKEEVDIYKVNTVLLFFWPLQFAKLPFPHSTLKKTIISAAHEETTTRICILNWAKKKITSKKDQKGLLVSLEFSSFFSI